MSLAAWWSRYRPHYNETTSETLTFVVTGILLIGILGIPAIGIAMLYNWLTMPSHVAYAGLALILLIYLGLFLLGLAALYVVVRVIRAAWRHGSGPAITEILRDEPLDRDA